MLRSRVEATLLELLWLALVPVLELQERETEPTQVVLVLQLQPEAASRLT